MTSSQPQSLVATLPEHQPSQHVQSALSCDATTSALDEDLANYSRGLDRSILLNSPIAVCRSSSTPATCYDSPASRAAASVALHGSSMNWPTPMSRLGQRFNFASPKDRRGEEHLGREHIGGDSDVTDDDSDDDDEVDADFTKTVPLSLL